MARERKARGEVWCPDSTNAAAERLRVVVTTEQMLGLERSWHVARGLGPSLQRANEREVRIGQFRVLALDLGIELTDEQREVLDRPGLHGGKAAHALLADALERRSNPDIGPILGAAAIVIRDLFQWVMHERRDRDTRHLDSIVVPYLFELYRHAMSEDPASPEAYGLAELLYGDAAVPRGSATKREQEWLHRLDRWRKQLTSDTGTMISRDQLGAAFLAGVAQLRAGVERK